MEINFNNFMFVAVLMTLPSLSYSEKKTVQLIVGGDLTFSGVIEYHVKIGNCTYNESLSKIKPILKEADHVMMNLESSFADLRFPVQPRDERKAANMISNISAAPTLKYAGIDIVALANNHMIDFGVRPLNKTIQILNNMNISQIGISFGKRKFEKQIPLILHERGVKIGFLSYCAVDKGCVKGDLRVGADIGPAVFGEKLFQEEVTNLRKKVDVILAFVHMGNEYTDPPDKSQDFLITKIYKYVDVVIGSHPHVTQKHYYNQNTLIVSSLGNFLFPPRPTTHHYFNYKKKKNRGRFDSAWYKATKLLPNPTKKGRLLKFEVSKSGLVRRTVQYLNTKIAVNSRHCLYVEKDGDWIDLCGKDDDQCIGTEECNELQCDEIYNVDKREKKTSTQKRGKYTPSKLIFYHSNCFM